MSIDVVALSRGTYTFRSDHRGRYARRTNLIFESISRSFLSKDVSLSNVADIARASRSYNLRNNITGRLVFDGHGFWQLLEGDRDRVLAFTNRIQRDPRHRDFRITRQGFRNAPRRFSSWSFAYAVDCNSEFPETWGQSMDAELAAQIEQGAIELDIRHAVEL